MSVHCLHAIYIVVPLPPDLNQCRELRGSFAVWQEKLKKTSFFRRTTIKVLERSASVAHPESNLYQMPVNQMGPSGWWRIRWHYLKNITDYFSSYIVWSYIAFNLFVHAIILRARVLKTLAIKTCMCSNCIWCLPVGKAVFIRTDMSVYNFLCDYFFSMERNSIFTLLSQTIL